MSNIWWAIIYHLLVSVFLSVYELKKWKCIDVFDVLDGFDVLDVSDVFNLLQLATSQTDTIPRQHIISQSIWLNIHRHTCPMTTVNAMPHPTVDGCQNPQMALTRMLRPMSLVTVVQGMVDVRHG